MSTQPITTTEWAKTNGQRFTFSVTLDNYEPARNYGHGHGWKYARLDDNRGPGVILETTGLPIGPDHMFLLDDGHSVTPYWVSGWSTSEPLLYLSPFPTNYADDGTPILRQNDKRPVDYTSWSLGPKKCYHLKVRETMTDAAWDAS